MTQGQLNHENLQFASVDKLLIKLGLLAAFLVPIRLSFTYIVILPMLALWGYRHYSNRAAIAFEVRSWVLPFFLFVAVSMVCALFGLNPVESMFHLARLGVMFLVAVMFWTVAKPGVALQLAAALFAGQLISAVHSLLETALPDIMPPFFYGPVTESGQLAITVIFASGLLLHLLRSQAAKVAGTASRSIALHSSLTALLVSGVAASAWLQSSYWLSLSLCGALLLWICWQLSRVGSNFRSGNRERAVITLLTVILLPTFFAALLVNLKRGPWAGVACGMVILLLFHQRQLIIPFLLMLVSAVLAFEPVADRLLDMPSHFFMSGGRGTIWDIGLELATRFPLGIGFDNSGVLSDFSAEVPDVLNHFHSNFLNILVETGWPGFALFLWWIYSTVRAAYTPLKAQPAPLSSTMLAVMVSWQVAGLVEYNFGDSEVLLVFLVVAGLTLRMVRDQAKAEIEA